MLLELRIDRATNFVSLRPRFPWLSERGGGGVRGLVSRKYRYINKRYGIQRRACKDDSVEISLLLLNATPFVLKYSKRTNRTNGHIIRHIHLQ